MAESIPSALTVGEIARRLNQPIHRIEYLIRSRGVRPHRIAGNNRVFAEQDLQRIEEELRQIALRKGHP